MGFEQKIRAVLRARAALPAGEVPFFEELLDELKGNPWLALSPAQRNVVELRYDALARRRGPG